MFDSNVVTTAAKTLLDDTTTAAMRTTLGLVIGVDVQAFDPDLGTLATAFISASASGPASLDFAEDADNGANRIRLIAPASIASDKTATLQDITGTLYITGGQDISVADGGTGLSTLTANNVILGNGASSPTFVAPGTSGNVLTSNGTTWTSAAATGGGGMTLLGILTTTSGTTQSRTGIATGYLQLYCEIIGVSFTTGATLTVALSSTNGTAYGTAKSVPPTLSSGSDTITGNLTIYGINSTAAAGKSCLGAANSGNLTAGSVDTNTAAVVNAIQFAGGTFDAGTIRIYGVK